MTLDLLSSVVALSSAVAMLMRSAHSRTLVLTAVVITSVLLVMQLGWVDIRVSEVRLLAWAATAAIGVYLFLKSQTRIAISSSTAMVFAASIPLGRITGFLA